MMNIYKVTRTDEIDWDQHDAFVCVAETEEDARNMTPHGDEWESELWESGNPRKTSWINRKDINTLEVELVGTAHEPARAVLSSFCAG